MKEEKRRTWRRGRGGGGRGGGGRGGRGGGGRGNGTSSGSGKPAPAYSIKYKAADGGEDRIDHKAVAYSDEWINMDKRAWKRSKLYDDDPEEWKAQQTKYKAWKAADSPGAFWEWKREVKKGTYRGAEEGSAPSANRCPRLG